MDNSDHQISIQPDYVLIERPQNYEVVRSKQPAFLTEISIICKEAGCRKVLILGPRTKVRLSTTEIFDLGQVIARSRLRIAVAEMHDASNDEVEFLENVATYRGGSIQFFDNDRMPKTG